MQDNHFAVSWSGGKDSCMALYEALQQGLKISHIVNFISDNPQKVRFHGTDARIISLQSQALGIPLFQKVTSWEEYERDFKAGVSELKSAGLTGMVFGDIYLDPHLEWVQRVCGEIGVEALEPLWHMDTCQLLDKFIKLGFKSVVICAKADLIERNWLGRVVDAEFMQYLINRNVDPCGENGEYHTLVVDGPLFSQPIELLETSVYEREGYYLLDIPRYRLKSA
jgi:diphthine-ammonia ligase